MSVIPFGAVGAIFGHWVMGQLLVFFSMLGIVALSGVVVNSSLVLVDYINRQRRDGVELMDAVLKGLVFITHWRKVRKSVSVLTWSVSTIGPVLVRRSASGCRTWCHRPGAPLPERLVA